MTAVAGAGRVRGDIEPESLVEAKAAPAPRGRVALVVPVFPRLSETFIVAKFLGLRARGWDARVVCGVFDAEVWSAFPELARRPALRRAVHVDWPHRPRWLAAGVLPAAALATAAANPAAVARYLRGGALRQLYLDARLAALGPDLVHFEFGALARGRMHLRRTLDCAVVVSFRGYDLTLVRDGDGDRYADVWASADAVHALGDDLWRRALAQGCPPEMPHALIPPAVDPDWFDPGERSYDAAVGVASRPLRVLGIGRLDWRKGYEYALHAVRLLRDRGIACEYHIVGDGPARDAVAFARRELGLADAVHLLGACPPARVRDELRWADVVLHAAVSEGFCNAVLEAQAMALPVVCTDAGGLPENVEDGRTGFAVPARRPDLLADRLVELARTPALRQRMGAAGRARVIERFDPARQLDAFERLYARALAARRERAP